ncbi:MAG: VOC family protein [Candidatus Binataceae bacterium]
MHIKCIERVLIAVADLDAASARWQRAGFAPGAGRVELDGVSFARLAAGAIEIDLCHVDDNSANGELANAIARKASNGGGVMGWWWGISADGDDLSGHLIKIPSLAGTPIAAAIDAAALDGVLTARVAVLGDKNARGKNLRRELGKNANTVEFLEHIVVMVAGLDDAIAKYEAIGLPCRRIREAGRGIRQAFFKLEDTVLEVVGPNERASGVWGLAFMCGDIEEPVAIARSNGLQATEPKAAVQGGRIARIVEPLDGVAVAFMEPAR